MQMPYSDVLNQIDELLAVFMEDEGRCFIVIDLAYQLRDEVVNLESMNNDDGN